MTNHGCINGTVDSAKYSSPVPVIGLYIAAASSVCMLLMLYDIVAGFRSRKPWLPCKFFSLNSITLTLLSISAKLPVDLTTPMPSSQDQVSKLSGTALICISMGFLLPSLGVNNDSEWLPNMSAMSIFVVTVIGNVCIQISTGVIVSFITEHIIIMCCMLVLLLMLWRTAVGIKNKKRSSIDEKRCLFTEGKGSMLQRLELCYLYGYTSNPQLAICKYSVCPLVGGLCLLCSVVLIQATLRSLVLKNLKFCRGMSDYDWSMPIIVVTQILTVIVGTFAASFRWLTMCDKRDSNWDISYVSDKDSTNDMTCSSPIFTFEYKGYATYRRIFGILIIIVFFLAYACIVVPSIILESITSCFRHKQKENVAMKKANDHFLPKIDAELDEWTVQKSEEDFKRSMKLGKSESTDHLSELLSRITPSQQSHRLRSHCDPDRGIVVSKSPSFKIDEEGCTEVSLLSIVLLVRIAQVSLPRNLSGSLVLSLSEAYKAIYYIENVMSPSSFHRYEKFRYAKALWAGKEWTCLLPKNFEGSIDQSQSELDRAKVILSGISCAVACMNVYNELHHISHVISSQIYSSIEDLHNIIEQYFVDMLHVLLAHLPVAIFKTLNDSPAEKYEERLTLAVKILSKVESLETKIQWSFPAGCSISSLIAVEAPTAQSRNDTQVRHVTQDHVNINVFTERDEGLHPCRHFLTSMTRICHVITHYISNIQEK